MIRSCLIFCILFSFLPVVQGQEVDFKALDVSYYFSDNNQIVIRSEDKYQDFLTREGYASQAIEIDFNNYYLVGYHGIDICQQSDYESSFSIFNDTITFDLFINQGYCLNIVYMNRWFLVNRKFIDKKIKFQIHEITAQLEEIKTDCFFTTEFERKTLIIETEEEYQNIFKESEQACKAFNFKKYSLLAEYNSIGGCGYPKMIKTVVEGNNHLVIQSRITQMGLCKRLNHFYTSFLIEKELLHKYENVEFTKEVMVDWR